ncbi:TerB family tellurite resistance protein [Campylobacter sp. RM16187]|uniref:TerB family tellurite resistance protein n=1 Tax=Campylobacter sp. RM16187 TaxID=1660063 RepID=UPI0021B4D9C4|nr:TerB family tellurite resistance protein [Campylobacter sp. RM16187]QKG29506.1 DnaJ-like membrane chaperone protein (N-terminal terB-like domain) [Campylobacter sp. RM16187]
MGNFFIIILIVLAIYLLAFDFGKNPQNMRQNVKNSRKKILFEEAKYIVTLLAKVAKSDGRVSELEAQLVSEILDDITSMLGGDTRKRDELKQIYNTQKEDLNNVYDVAREYYEKFKLSKNDAIAKVSFLINLAYIDGRILNAERIVISQIADAFNISDRVLEEIFDKFDRFYDQKRYEQRKDDSYHKKSPYRVLGLRENAPFSEVKKRYRELVKKYHPDILMGRGESEEIIERSTRKLQEINEAYEEIKGRSANN